MKPVTGLMKGRTEARVSCMEACVRGAAPLQRPRIARREGGPLVVCIHGILTGQTQRSWCDRFEVWAWGQNPAVHVLKREYWGGPVPAINCWLRNPLQARALADEILAFARAGAGPVSIIAHSNGCDIALKTAHRLSALGMGLRSLVLIGGACDSDVIRGGVWQLVDGGGLERAIAYSSAADAAVRSRWIWPYGRLGFTGWTMDGLAKTGPKIFTRWFTPYAHSEYFAADRIEKTFDRAWRDCGLPYEVPL